MPEMEEIKISVEMLSVSWAYIDKPCHAPVFWVPCNYSVFPLLHTQRMLTQDSAEDRKQRKTMLIMALNQDTSVVAIQPDKPTMQ